MQCAHRPKAPRRSGLTRSVAGAAGVLFTLSLAPVAHAFCRATTCDLALSPSTTAAAECTRNLKVDLCSTQGKPLYWPNGCLWFGIAAGGSSKLGISTSEFHDVVKQAFDIWANVDCGNGTHPSFALLDTDELFGSVECASPEFNAKAANANVWMFNDSTWAHDDPENTLGLTLTTADLSTGEIYDADVQVNSFAGDLALHPVGSQASLLTVVLHEAGHYLGLAHSSSRTALMYASYSPNRADLDDDDRAGICTIYPPQFTVQCEEPEPKYGFSRYCGGANPSTTPQPKTVTPQKTDTLVTSGCSVSPVPPGTSASFAWWCGAGAVLSLGLARRRPRRTQSNATG